MAENTLTITDNRTGRQYEIAIENETVKALDLRKIKVADDDFGLMTYDPAFMNTASCKSRIRSSTATKEFSSIAEFRSTCWLRKAAISKSLTCCCMASCQPKPS